MEPFILAALTAFNDSNGDIVEFESLLRKSMNTMYSSGNLSAVVFADIEDALVKMTPETVDEMANMDFDRMSDEQVLDYMRIKGLIKSND